MVNNNRSKQREFNLRAQNICKSIANIASSKVKPNNSISKDLIENYTNTPEAFLSWGARLIDNGHIEIGAEFIKEACNNADYDKKPGIIYNKSIKILSKYGFAEAREAILLQAINKAPEDLYFNASLAKVYIEVKDPKKAIELIEDLDRRIIDDFTYNVLAEAYIQDENPKKALEILGGCSGLDDYTICLIAYAHIHNGHPEKACDLFNDKYRGEEVSPYTIVMWANASVMSKNRKDFDHIKGRVNNESMRDYLDAKLCYFENDISRMQSILTPYINSKHSRQNMTSLYALSLPEDSPIHEVLRDIYGKDNYDLFMKNKEAWINNPNISFRYDRSETEITPLYEYGGNPVNQTERSKLGIGRELPVSAVNNMWLP